jgi:hypothetical protein
MVSKPPREKAADTGIEGEDPLDPFLGRLSERSMSWVARRAVALGAEVAGQSDPWIERRLIEVLQSWPHAPSVAEVLRPWRQWRQAIRALALEAEARRRREQAEQAAGRPDRGTVDADRDRNGRPWVWLPPHQRDLLGQRRATHFVIAARRTRRRLERYPTELIERWLAEPEATLPSLDRHVLASIAEYVALRRVQIARRQLGWNLDVRAGAHVASVGLVAQLVEQCHTDLGRERAALVVAHAAALVAEIKQHAELASVVAYRDALHVRLAAADRDAIAIACRIDGELHHDEQLHDWRSGVADAANANANDRDDLLSGEQRRRLTRTAEFRRRKARALEPRLATATDQQRTARRERTHPDCWTDLYARLIAAQFVVESATGQVFSSALANDTEQRLEVRRTAREASTSTDAGIEA